jgi:hypothetical protein
VQRSLASAAASVANSGLLATSADEGCARGRPAGKPGERSRKGQESLSRRRFLTLGGHRRGLALNSFAYFC